MSKAIDVVGAVILDKISGKYLVTRRNINKHQGGLWEFPGGKIESGESPSQALIREIKEELGCEIKVLDMIKDYTHSYGDRVIRLITYLSVIEKGDINLSEHEEFKWVDKEEMQRLSFAEADIPTVKKITSG